MRISFVVFLGMVAYSGYMMHSVNATARSIENALFTKDGYSAVDGSQLSKEIYLKDHPAEKR